jgi:hypothetical protein
VESLLGERTSRRSTPAHWFERAITFDPTDGSPSNFYRSFRTPFSFGVDLESLLGEAKLSAL